MGKQSEYTWKHTSHDIKNEIDHIVVDRELMKHALGCDSAEGGRGRCIKFSVAHKSNATHTVHCSTKRKGGTENM